MLKITRRRVRLVLVVILVGVAGWLGSSALVAWRFTHRAAPPCAEPTPEVPWGDVQGYRLHTADGQEIGAWFVRGAPDRGCVVLVHGNGGSRQTMLPVMKELAEARFTALAISLRCHGDSTGEINDFGFSARLDVIAAVEFLGRECPSQPIYIVGRSLGAAAAIFAAGELKERVAGYFLEQPYKDLRSATWNRLRNRLPPVLDWIAYGGLRLWAPVFLPVDLDRLSPDGRLEDIPQSIPIVFVTGAEDRHALLPDVTAMYDRVESHAQLVVIPGAVHEALDRKDPERYWEALFTLLGRRPGTANRE